MKKNKGENKIVLCMLLLACLLSVMPVVPSQAGWLDFGWQTEEFTKDENKPADEQCNLLRDVEEAKNKGKWWKTPLETALKASLSVGKTVSEKAAPGAQKLMFVGAGLWLAVFTLKVVGSMVESDPRENLTKVGGMMLKVGFAAACLSSIGGGEKLYSSYSFFDVAIASVVEAGAGFVDTSDITGVDGAVKMGNVKIGGGLDAVEKVLIDMAEETHTIIADVIGRGRFLGCIGDIHKLSLSVAGDVTFPDPKVWMSSCVIVVGAYFFLFLFPFYLIEVCVRLGIVVALSPLFVVAWVFDVTREFTKKGVQALLHVAFTFMMIKIIVLVATKLLMGGAGLDKLKTGGLDEKKQIVCTFRWGYLGDDDVCEGVEKGETNNMFIYLACIVYGWLLLSKGNELANYYSNTNFSADSSFAAARNAGQMVHKAAQTGVNKTINAAGAVKDRIQTHKDRAAARTYEKDQRARAAAANGGPAYNPSAKQLKKVEAAKKRLQSERVGALNSDGTENGQKMSKLLENGKARTAMRGLEKIHNATVGRLADKVGISKFGQKLSSKASYQAKNGNFFERQAGKIGNRLGKDIQNIGSHDKYKNMGSSYSERSAEQLQNLKSVAPTGIADVNERDVSLAKQRMANMPPPTTEQERKQQFYNQAKLLHQEDVLDYNKKVAADPNYANSVAGQKAMQKMTQDNYDLQQYKNDNGVNDDLFKSKTAKEKWNTVKGKVKSAFGG
ncbi:MAG: hypothetical protein ACI4TE_07340 [Alphaproteobacteria bacterium]